MLEESQGCPCHSPLSLQAAWVAPVSHPTVVCHGGFSLEALSPPTPVFCWKIQTVVPVHFTKEASLWLLSAALRMEPRENVESSYCLSLGLLG